VSSSERHWSTWIAGGLALLFLLLWMKSLHDTRVWRDRAAELVGHSHDQAVELDRGSSQLQLLTSPDAVHVSLNPQKTPKQPTGTAIFSPADRRMMLLASNLRATPDGKAYELWIVPAQGASLAGGVFKPDERGNAVLINRKIPEGLQVKTFAVTLENEAGADKPSSPIVLTGAEE
jgi:hypothetical protein